MAGSRGEKLEPRGAAAAPGPRVRNNTPPPSTHSASSRRCDGVKPGTSSMMSNPSEESSEGWSGTADSGRSCTPSASALNACSTAGGPPVATCEVAGSLMEDIDEISVGDNVDLEEGPPGEYENAVTTNAEV